MTITNNKIMRTNTICSCPTIDLVVADDQIAMGVCRIRAICSVLNMDIASTEDQICGGTTLTYAACFGLKYIDVGLVGFRYL